MRSMTHEGGEIVPARLSGFLNSRVPHPTLAARGPPFPIPREKGAGSRSSREARGCVLRSIGNENTNVRPCSSHESDFTSVSV